MTAPITIALVKQDPNRGNLRYVFKQRDYTIGPRGLPLLKPPYGRITAIDLNRGEHVWMVANGDGPRDHPLLKDLHLPRLGQPGRAAPLLTKTLLVLGEGDPINLSTPVGGFVGSALTERVVPGASEPRFANCRPLSGRFSICR